MDPCPLAHHWLIDARPRSGLYHATCKVCGVEREFPEDATRFKFRMGKNVIPAQTVEMLLGLPAGSASPVPSGGESTIV